MRFNTSNDPETGASSDGGPSSFTHWPESQCALPERCACDGCLRAHGLPPRERCPCGAEGCEGGCSQADGHSEPVIQKEMDAPGLGRYHVSVSLPYPWCYKPETCGLTGRCAALVNCGD